MRYLPFNCCTSRVCICKLSFRNENNGSTLSLFPFDCSIFALILDCFIYFSDILTKVFANQLNVTHGIYKRKWLFNFNNISVFYLEFWQKASVHRKLENRQLLAIEMIRQHHQNQRLAQPVQNCHQRQPIGQPSPMMISIVWLPCTKTAAASVH